MIVAVPTVASATAVSRPRRDQDGQDGENEEELADHTALRSPGLHVVIGLVDTVTFVALFFLAVFLLGLVVGLALMFWRARQDRRYLRLRQGKNEITARIATKTSTA